VTPGHDDMLVLATGLQGLDDPCNVEMVVAQCDVELVEHDQPDRSIGHHLRRRGPGALRCCHIACAVLGLPGEALTQSVPFDLVAEPLDGRALTGLPGALAELNHPAA